MSMWSIAKRRAMTARLLAFFLCSFVLTFSASALAAVPPSPKLVTTNPPSTETTPALSITPLILGEAEPEDGIIRESAPVSGRPVLFSAPRAVEKPTKNPNFKIQIFYGAGCSGTAMKTGTASELEESGIPVNVSANVKTTLSALQVDPSAPTEPSPCSEPLYYWEGDVPVEEGAGGGGTEKGGGGSSGGSSEAGGGDGSQGGGASQGIPSSGGGSVSGGTPAGGKPAAPRIHVSPAERSNDPTPLILGSAPGADNVSIYANENCSGTPVAKGSASQLSSGFEVSVPENTATTFSAVAIGAQRSSCSSPITYTEDSTAPQTRITMGPGVKTRKHKAIFRFQDVTEDPPGTTFRCKVNRANWKPCSSPFRLKHLKPRHYILKIQATDLAGNVEPRPVKRTFIVVSGDRR
jgi:hypothetical protein